VTAAGTAQVKRNARDLEDSDAVHALARWGSGPAASSGSSSAAAAVGGPRRVGADRPGRRPARRRPSSPSAPRCSSCSPSASSATACGGCSPPRSATAPSPTRRRSGASAACRSSRAWSTPRSASPPCASCSRAAARTRRSHGRPELMAAPGGRVLVGVLGLVVIGVGRRHGGQGGQARPREDLETGRMPAGLRHPAVKVGVVGLIGRGRRLRPHRPVPRARRGAVRPVRGQGARRRAADRRGAAVRQGPARPRRPRHPRLRRLVLVETLYKRL
jgi:hypothetical protein